MDNDDMRVNRINLTEAHEDLIALLSQIASSKPTVLQWDGKDMAALISIEDLHLIERLIEEEEDRIDIADAEKVLTETKEEDWIPFEQIKAQLGS